MILDDGDSDLFRMWVVRKLEAISDADSEVLADYVLALVKTDDLPAVAKVNCTQNLRDFLGINAEGFVEDAFQAIATKSYDPSRPPPPVSATAPVYKPLRRASYDAPSLPNEARKRSHRDRDADDLEELRFTAYQDQGRPGKQLRRGGTRTEGRGYRPYEAPRNGPEGAPAWRALPQMYGLPPLPSPPPGMPALDANNLALLFVMQQAMGMLPANAGTDLSLVTNGGGQDRPSRRCRDYDQKGFCTQGAACPYEHGESAYIVQQQADEYDPTNALTGDMLPKRIGNSALMPTARGRGAHRPRGRGYGAPFESGNGRADFSMTGANPGKSLTSIVVEQIPEDNCNESSVHEFFSAFGTIAGITMQPFKRRAIVKYEDYDAAKAAYSSPKSVFDNRFVKVYWCKPDKLPQLPQEGEPNVQFDGAVAKHEDTNFDHAAFLRQQEEAQRRYDEAKQKRDDVQRHRAELDEKLRAINQERQKFVAMLAKKTGTLTGTSDESREGEENRLLKAKLAEVLAEAEALGIDPEGDGPSSNDYAIATSYRGRSGYRGYYSTRGRGGHYQSAHRGAYGSNGYRGGYGGTARVTRSLDNRPKTISVAFTDGSRYAEREEALRQYLMFNGLESATLTAHPGREDAALIAFQQRFEAENFMSAALFEGPSAASGLPNVLGKVELAWWKPESASGFDAITSKVQAAVANENQDPVSAATLRAVESHLVKEDRDMDTYDEGDDI
ncbi:hypothetical protein BAUCODRAFT_34203 [Baudoinia panamericana UAMH 10762]|uniref:C3H1-type domain-containing protein n=1 Tax=Baudoinia panamericana (strain UAMH 10762) TaxID=717646 RepID=M2MJE6_BAUPA|nr:uncharacterized protein BAUCODRAFT_34203 [Baudoinia panamericana UAMH 10762]EMC96811.1 hypothetical protein BAUCODRAFT_34203 [Baudoinia panamericana UAMH 10762]